MTTLIALLRGVNVGGTGKIPMGELRSALSSLGLEDVATYIQSGNVFFRATGEAADIAAAIEKQIVDVFGLTTTVLVRTPAELRKIAAGNPFLERQADLSRLHVAFLDAAPSAAAVAGLDPERSPPDEFAVRGREIYLHYPNGSGRSKLTLDYLERRLGARGTVRNCKTVNKLIELTSRP